MMEVTSIVEEGLTGTLISSRQNEKSDKFRFKMQNFNC